MKRILAAVIAAFTTANGLIMLLDGPHWYATVPGVPDTGPYNGHFIQDIGLAFLVAGVALAVTAWRPRCWPAGAAGAAFLAGHALLHLVGMVAGHDHQTGFDLLAIVVPAALAVYATLPIKETQHA